ncbi:Cys/Met metabolism PLP-dependent enzyme-domain-containing protein [Mycena amicta]|nr:Cys/Met metabolism PLP-dependent enzyme-domain-containing protein [Mycena amicta]
MSRKVQVKGTHLVHGDDEFRVGGDVAPTIGVSTTFISPRPDEDGIKDYRNPSRHVYSRYTTQNSVRVERLLSEINDGFALVYSSGLAAGFAALVFFKPKRLAFTEGYTGTKALLQVYLKIVPDLKIINLDDEFQAGDLCWLETPLNPTGEAKDIRFYADKVHRAGGKLLVDSTFAPPPLQYPFNFGADCIMHSGTKYFGGHSDLLAGVLVVRKREEWDVLQSDRTYLGSMIGSLESWLLLRSLRTYHLRLSRQSETATALVQWLQKIVETPEGQSFDGIPGGIILRVWHSSLQIKDSRGFEPKSQMAGGWNATFSIQLSKPQYAAWFPHALKYFTPATSLGGVESLAEYRFSWDPTSDPRAVRLSIGVEDLDDLKQDIGRGLKHLVNESAKL